MLKMVFEIRFVLKAPINFTRKDVKSPHRSETLSGSGLAVEDEENLSECPAAGFVVFSFARRRDSKAPLRSLSKARATATWPKAQTESGSASDASSK